MICNDVIEDKRTSNKSLIGIFNAVSVSQVPATHHRLNVLASITNAASEIPIELVMRSPSGRDVMRVQGAVPGTDPLAVIDVIFELAGVPLDELGTYNVDIMSGASYLGGRRFQVIANWVPQA